MTWGPTSVVKTTWTLWCCLHTWNAGREQSGKGHLAIVEAGRRLDATLTAGLGAECVLRLGDVDSLVGRIDCLNLVDRIDCLADVIKTEPHGDPRRVADWQWHNISDELVLPSELVQCQSGAYIKG